VPHAPGKLTVYSTTWCGYCHRLKAQLRRAGVGFLEVDIDAEPAAAEVVARVNRGNLTVPTVVFADGSALTNPAVRDVTARLAALAG
jgi:mycoredoxin